MTSSPTVNLLDLDAQGLVAYCDSLGEKPFRAKQLQRWIHQYNAADFDGMTDLAKSLREKLKGRATITMPGIVSDNISTDGTRKWLIDVGNSNAVETVYIPEETRGTLCVSSQAGCAVNCRFCSTGKQGFSRNLTTGEIIGQLRMAEFALRATRGTDGGRATGGDGKGERVVTNVVMMGMGEPLLNYDAVVPAMRLMLDDNAYGLSRRRVTLSTSGVVPMMDRLGADLPVALAVSLHAPSDPLRDMLVPLNKKYPLRELMAVRAAMQDHVKARIAQTLGNDKGLLTCCIALMDHVDIATFIFRHELLFFQQLEDTLDTHCPAARARRLAAKLFDQRIVTAAGCHCTLRAKLVGHPFEHGQIVIIETAHETRVDRERNVVRLQNALQAFEVRARFFAEKIDQLRRVLRDFLHRRILRVEHAQRVRVQAALCLLVEHVHVLFEVRDQLDAMCRALFCETQRIEFELDAHQPKVVPQALAHHDDFSVGVRAREA